MTPRVYGPPAKQKRHHDKLTSRLHVELTALVKSKWAAKRHAFHPHRERTTSRNDRLNQLEQLQERQRRALAKTTLKRQSIQYE
jgi:hypothetical protein